MPSAAAKIESEDSFALDSLKQVLVFVDKKIRNLEKKKGKLDLYKVRKEEGMELNKDQEDAVSKRELVCEQISFAKELSKSIGGMFSQLESDSKKRIFATAHARPRTPSPLPLPPPERILVDNPKRIEELLQLQILLVRMASKNVHGDFIRGENGAVKLGKTNLERLDKLYALVNVVDTETTDEDVKRATSHIQSYLDCVKEAAFDDGTTYQELNELVEKIHKCGYFSSKNINLRESLRKSKDVEKASEQTTSEDTASVPSVEFYSTSYPSDLSGQTAGLAFGDYPLVAQDVPAALPSNNFNSYFDPSRPYLANVEETINFLQESQVDVIEDPAVVEAQPMTISQAATSTGFYCPPSVAGDGKVVLAEEIDNSVSFQSTPNQHSMPNAALTNQKFQMNPNAAMFQTSFSSGADASHSKQDGSSKYYDYNHDGIYSNDASGHSQIVDSGHVDHNPNPRSNEFTGDGIHKKLSQNTQGSPEDCHFQQTVHPTTDPASLSQTVAQNVQSASGKNSRVQGTAQALHHNADHVAIHRQASGQKPFHQSSAHGSMRKGSGHTALHKNGNDLSSMQAKPNSVTNQNALNQVPPTGHLQSQTNSHGSGSRDTQQTRVSQTNRPVQQASNNNQPMPSDTGNYRPGTTFHRHRSSHQLPHFSGQHHRPSADTGSVSTGQQANRQAFTSYPASSGHSDHYNAASAQQSGPAREHFASERSDGQLYGSGAFCKRGPPGMGSGQQQSIQGMRGIGNQPGGQHRMSSSGRSSSLSQGGNPRNDGFSSRSNLSHNTSGISA